MRRLRRQYCAYRVMPEGTVSTRYYRSARNAIWAIFNDAGLRPEQVEVRQCRQDLFSNPFIEIFRGPKRLGRIEVCELL